MEKICPICEVKSIFILKINGYVEGLEYYIFQCIKCGLQFAEDDRSNLGLIYDSIYKYSSQIDGYDRYVLYYNQILNKKGKNAINYLIEKEDTYKYIYRYLINLENCRDLRLLEVGSGLGYFTYALSEDGFNILGVDLSQDAVTKSTAAFGNLYKAINFNDLDEKFDIIILTEVIEHVSSPASFLNDIKLLLKNNGKILLTTPRKHIDQRKSIWLTELPPVHLFWFTTLALQQIGNNIGLDFFEINVKQKSIIFDTKTNAKASLDSNLIPKLRTEKELKSKKSMIVKSTIIRWSPYLLRKIIYKYIKNQKVSISKSHNSIFFGYKLKI